jgi:DnaJ-class molecular chaperone
MDETYYTILEISENATLDEIKKSYRRLSLKYHPDKNLNDGDAVKKFHKITEAYETLGNEEKKQEYDLMRNNSFAKMFQRGGGSNTMDQFDPMEEMLSNLFGMHGMPFGMKGGGPMGMGFASPNIHIFKNGVPVGGLGSNQLQKPTPIIKSLYINMEQVLTGATVPIDIERWIIENGTKMVEKETLYVDIPRGIDDNEIIIIRERGNIMSDFCKGDVKLFIKVSNNTDLQRNGLDLILEKKITLKESLCGFSFDLKYVNGKNYTINNNSGNIIPPGHKKIIPNMGLTRDKHTGNLIIAFEVEFPTKLKEDIVLKLSEIL